jgi:CDP-L-myo-inositol myo-inositolphosphotransferase
VKVVIMAVDKDGGQPKALLRLCGLPLVKRLVYTLRSVGLREVIIVTESGNLSIPKTVGDGQDLGMSITYVPAEGDAFPVGLLERIQGEKCLVIEGHYVLDERIIGALAQGDHLTLGYDSELEHQGTIRVLVEAGRVKEIGSALAESNGSYVGIVLLTAEALPILKECPAGRGWPACLARIAQEWPVVALDVSRLDPYVAGMRRELKPLWFGIETAEERKRCQEALVQGAQKRTLDLLAWYFNRPIENWIIRRIADWPITPNQMSILTNGVAFLATGLFLLGQFLPASLLTFVVNVMDGLDGKLARVKGMTSKLGNIEHSFDLLYEQSWYIAFAWALYVHSKSLLPLILGFTLLLFDSFARHVSMQFKQVMGVSLADYAPFDRLFRKFDGRRNIYTIYILVGVLLGVPIYALAGMTVHAAMTALIYAYRAAKHMHAADKGQAFPSGR